MGFGQPAAIGACLGSGGKRTICVDGDGGFAMNIQELETVKRMRLPIKFFVINNRGYASIRSSQTNYFNRLVGADETSGLSLPDWGKVSNAFGITCRSVSIADDLPKAVQETLFFPGPAICEVVVIPDEPREPRVSSAIGTDGSMVSRPLEDLFPFLEREEFLQNMLIPDHEDGSRPIES